MPASSRSRVIDLLITWKEADEQGRNLSAEDLCESCPELLPDLRRRIAEIREMRRHLGDTAASISEIVPEDRDRDLVRAELIENHLVAPEQMDLAAERISGTRGSAAWPLIQQLIQQEALTSFQAERVARGRTSELVLGNYVLLKRIGEGGMGQVFEARHRRMNRRVALKVLSPNLTRTPAAAKRFQREVEAAARLLHPNIVTAFDADEADDTPFLVMELVDGDDLARVIHRDGPPSVGQVINYILQAARGLAYAHARGVVHRDIKPSNLLLDDQGVVKVLDMGLARVTGAADDPSRTELTATGIVMGTIDYMAPEQAMDTKTADARSDIYSLGCTLIFLLTGKPAYAGESALAKLLAHREQPIPSLSVLREEIPDRLDAVLRRMIAKSPEDRFQSMADVVAELEDCLAEQSTFPLGSAASALSGSDRTRPPAPPTRIAPSENATATFDSPTLIEPDQEALNVLARTAQTNRRKAVNRRPRHLAGFVWPAAMCCLGAATAVMIYFSAAPSVTKPEETDRRKTVNGRVATSEAPPVAAPIVDYALSFDGIDDYVELPSFEYVDGRPLTVEARVSLPEVQKFVGTIFHTRGEGSSDRNPSVTLLLPYLRNGETQRSIDLGIVRGNQNDYDRASGGDFGGRTIQIAAVVQEGTRRIFINGKRVNTQTRNYKPADTTKIKTTLGATLRQDGSLDAIFQGRIDELRVSPIARYTEDYEVADRLTADEHTLALYHFDEGTGDILKDSSGNGRHGKIFGATWVESRSPLGASEKTAWFVPTDAANPQLPQIPSSPVEAIMPTNHVLHFDGQDDYVELTTLKLPQGPVTMELWASPRIGEKPFTLLNAIGDAGAAIYLRPTHGFCAAYQAGLIYEDVIRTNGSAYYHVALVSDGTAFELFVDGVPSGRASPKTPDATPWGISFLGTEQNWVENAHDKPNLNRLFAGRLDEVRISTIARYTGQFTPSRRFVRDEHTLALYHCDEGRGSILKDSSGHGHHGKIFGATWGPSDSTPAADPDRRAAEWVLSIGGTVRMNNTERDLDEISELPSDGFRLTWIALQDNQQVSDAGLACFQDCRNVRYLWLDHTQISDVGLAHFQNCKNLGGLAVSNATQVTDAGLAHFQGCKNLTHLDFDHTQITDVGLAYFQDCERLMYLDLRGTKISDAGLVHVRGRETLKAVLLAETSVTDAGLARFQNCKALTLLDMDHTEISDAGLVYFQDCKALTYLDVHATGISDAGLEPLAGLTKLEELYLWKTQVTGQGVGELHKKLPQCTIYWDGGVIEPEKPSVPPPVVAPIDAAMAPVDPDRRAAEWVLSIGGQIMEGSPSRGLEKTSEWPPDGFRLTWVFLRGNQQVTDAGLACFQYCQHVRHLWLDRTKITDAGLAHFRNCKKLIALSLNNTGITDAGLAYVQDDKSLTHLDLGGTKITDAGLDSFQDCKNLTYLCLGETKIGDAGLVHFQVCKKLKSIFLNDTKVSDAGLAYFQNCGNLTDLILANTSVSDAGLAHFQDCEHLDRLLLNSTKVSDEGLAYFRGCKNLIYLDLNTTRITDAGLDHLVNFTKLEKLDLQSTQVTAAGVAALHERLPKCKIQWDGGTIEPE